MNSNNIILKNFLLIFIIIILIIITFHNIFLNDTTENFSNINDASKNGSQIVFLFIFIGIIIYHTLFFNKTTNLLNLNNGKKNITKMITIFISIIFSVIISYNLFFNKTTEGFNVNDIDNMFDGIKDISKKVSSIPTTISDIGKNMENKMNGLGEQIKTTTNDMIVKKLEGIDGQIDNLIKQ
jgi:magnesium-transporting ATPase (P-type)